jgi:hypothetical protein
MYLFGEIKKLIFMNWIFDNDNQEADMKTLIFITIISTILLLVGCSTTTYLSLTENNKEQIEQKLKYDEQDENVGAEVTLLLKDRTKVKGELLYVQDSTLTICTEHSAKKEELANLTYPINTFRNDRIQEITIEGGNYVWAGIGYGALGGAALGAILFYVASEGNTHITQGYAALVGGVLGVLAGAIAGGIIGATSYDDIILQEIPPDYKWSISRYPDKEPQYLRVIK